MLADDLLLLDRLAAAPTAQIRLIVGAQSCAGVDVEQGAAAISGGAAAQTIRLRFSESQTAMVTIPVGQGRLPKQPGATCRWLAATAGSLIAIGRRRGIFY